MTHENAYGAQAASCPGGHESLAGEPACGVDPYTGSGITFDRESGFNAYTITVRNTGDEATGRIISTLTCESGKWYEGPTSFGYQWLRDGVAIANATAKTYTLTPADEGKAIQCVVTGSNPSGATSFPTSALVGSPEPATRPPVDISTPEISDEDSTVPVAEELTCDTEAEEWEGEPTFSYQWLRNGDAIAGATGATYTTTEADAGAALQCQVTATNAGGSVVAISREPAVVEPEPSEFPPYSNRNGDPTIEGSGNESGNAAVSVSDQLPPGLELAGLEPLNEHEPQRAEVSGAGWSCVIANPSTVTCTRADALAAGASYPPITLHVHVGAAAPLGSPPGGGVTNVATVYGGGASPASASASDPTAVAEVPFGIHSFTTSVTEALGNPFTQAGGHPLSANATFVFNYVPDDVGRLRTAGGSPKDIETELPPGFVGNPQATPKCPVATFEAGGTTETPCPLDTAVGYIHLSYFQGAIEGGRPQPFVATSNFDAIYNLETAPGHPAAFGFVGGQSYSRFTLDASVRSDGDYGITIGSPHTATPTLLAAGVSFCENGVTQSGSLSFLTFACAPADAGSTPFLTNPTRCEGPASVTTLSADTYENPASYASMASYAGAASAPPSFAGAPGTSATPDASSSFATGCDLLQFQPEVEFKPSSAAEGGTTQADEPTGATFDLKLPQPEEEDTNATPELKSATVTLPQGMTVDPAAADGLQACSDAQFGLGSTAEPAPPAACPPASQIGTVKIVTPLLEKPLPGEVFIGEPECSPCSDADAQEGHLFRLFLQAYSPAEGVVVKLAGKVSANPTTGQLQATFTQQPQLPFSELLLTFSGGARAPLANPQSCGVYTTGTDLTPWSAPGLGGPSGAESIAGTADATPSSSFAVDFDGQGGACPGMAFAPSFSAGSQTPSAGASSPFSVSFGREDREQDLAGITVTTPPGLLGAVSQVARCPEAQANAGACGAESQIGTTTVGAGPGPDPFYLGGKVYLTGPYRGQPFGLSIVVPALAGPFNLGTVVVRASIAVNPVTAALTIASDPLPQFVDGVQLRLRRIDVEVNRPGFMLNPTSCALQRSVAATVTAAQGASANVSSPFGVGGCESLGFTPKLSASTQGKASKAGGASLDVTVKATPGQANIAKVDLQLPKVLPSRLTTLHKACTAAVFDANPAGCSEESIIGTARAVTPILSAPLAGPAYLVSHGGTAFPDVEFVLQGEGVTIDLDGKTDIKHGVTYSLFETVPDAPIGLFEASLPEGPHSILGTDLPAKAKYSLCGQALSMATIITAQNGKQVKQSTKLAVTGCKASTAPTRKQKLTKALKRCKQKKNKQKRVACEAQERKRYGAKVKSKKPAQRPTNGKVVK